MAGFGTVARMATAAAIQDDEAIVIVHEPSQRFVAVGFALCDDAEVALHFTDEHVAEAVIARHPELANSLGVTLRGSANRRMSSVFLACVSHASP